MPVGHLFVFFGKVSIQILCPFFNQVVWVFLLLLSCPLNYFKIISIAYLFHVSVLYSQLILNSLRARSSVLYLVPPWMPGHCGDLGCSFWAPSHQAHPSQLWASPGSFPCPRSLPRMPGLSCPPAWPPPCTLGSPLPQPTWPRVRTPSGWSDSALPWPVSLGTCG